MNYESYSIPTNFTDAGRVFGLFEMRNLVEAVVLTLPIVYICFAVLPVGLTAKIIASLTIAVPVGGFALVGIGGDSLSRWIKSWWQWRRHRRLMFYRGEVSVK